MNLKQKLARLHMAPDARGGAREAGDPAVSRVERDDAALFAAAAARPDLPADATTAPRCSSALTGELASAEERLGTIASLRERLGALQASGRERTTARLLGGQGCAERAPDRGAAAAHAAARSSARSQAASLASASFLRELGAWEPPASAPRARTLPGVREETPHGPLCRTFKLHEVDHRHGSAAVARGREACAADVALLALDPALATIDFSRALYIDTETTGLAGGSGTIPFLIGMAWFEGEQLAVEQLFLERPGLEGPMLVRLRERIAAASVIVSYNGKSFDWPLLRTRFILNRLAAPALPAHLDLLHCARRVYKARLGSVRLVYLEQELLGFERIGDIAGELIPETYFAFLRGAAEGAALHAILEHNRSDLIALPALLGELLTRFRGEVLRESALDKLGFARVAVRAAAHDRALACARAAVDSDARGEHTATALLLIGGLERRAGAIEGALAALEQALEASRCKSEAARAHLALAKLHEQKTKRLEQALAHARHTAPCEGEPACAHRVARLERRLARNAAKRERPPG